jgi:hypothetical protein
MGPAGPTGPKPAPRREVVAEEPAGFPALAGPPAPAAGVPGATTADYAAEEPAPEGEVAKSAAANRTRKGLNG